MPGFPPPPHPPPTKYYHCSIQVTVKEKSSRLDEVSAHNVTFLKIVSQNAPNCMSMQIHFKTFPEGYAGSFLFVWCNVLAMMCYNCDLIQCKRLRLWSDFPSYRYEHFCLSKKDTVVMEHRNRFICTKAIQRKVSSSGGSTRIFSEYASPLWAFTTPASTKMSKNGYPSWLLYIKTKICYDPCFIDIRVTMAT